MTLEEANTIARIIETADGGCGHCVMQMAADLNNAFPDFEWLPDDSRDGAGVYPMKAIRTSLAQ